MKLNRLVCLCAFALLALNVTAGRPAKQWLPVADEACNHWVDSVLSTMTLKQKIGQLLIHTVSPATSKRNMDEIRRAIDDYSIGGLLFSGGDVEKQALVTNMAQQRSEIPLLITFDGEWGLSMRLKNMPEFPKNRVLGCIQGDSLIYQYGREVARELREIGVHINFAPVADVDNNPSNPVINVRSFGSDARKVADKVSAYVRGLQDGGVMAVCKHFPGHGDTETDSHLALPVLQFDRQRLDSVELLPFRAAIKAGVGGVMVGHLHVPQLSDKPASISEDVIVRTLRNELGFQGMVITDALEMKGISEHADNVSARALMAGNDLLLVPRNLKKELAGILQAVKNGSLKTDDIESKCRRVLALKYALGLNKHPLVEEAGLKARICTSEAEKLRAKLEQASVTVVKDSVGMLPLDLSLSGNVLLSISSSLSAAYPFYKGLSQSLPITWIHADADSLSAAYARIRPSQQVIVAIHQEECEAYIPLLEKVAAEKPLVLVCFQPMDVLSRLGNVPQKASAVVLAHRDVKTLQSEVAEMMIGRGYADGRLSVNMNGLWQSGTGVTLDPNHPKSYKPEDFGMSSLALAQIDSIVSEGIREQAFPGCHVLVLKKGYPIYNKCFGHFTYEGSREVKENDLFDLASVSKAAGTLLAVMKLYDEGRFGLTDAVSKYVPELKGTDKQKITIRELLFHESGLPAYLPVYENAIDLKACKGGLYRKKPDALHTLQIEEGTYVNPSFPYKSEWVSETQSADYSLRLSEGLYLRNDYKKEVLQQIVDAPLKGHSYRYSCVNFMLLKEMVERIAQKPLDVYLDSVFYRPMGLSHTLYNPLSRFSKNEIAPTAEYAFLRRTPLQGEVNDEAAAFMGGVSGNAGLFSTAHDVGAIFQMLLDKGICGDRRYLSRATCELFTTMKAGNSRRGLGFDRPDKEHPDHSPCAPEAPAAVFGHTGFTGTCVWADPENDMVFVFLSNRTYPIAFRHTKLTEKNIRPRIQQAIYRSLKP